MVDMKASEALRESRQLIEENGWVQGAYSNNDGYCSIGALDEIYHRQVFLDEDASNMYLKAIAFLHQAITGHKGEYNERIFPIQEWNDDLLRTKQEIIGAFLAAETLAITQETRGAILHA